MAERHILLFSRPGRGVLVFLPAAGTEGSLLYCPAAGTVESLLCCPVAGLWVSAPNLLTKIPAIFEKHGTPGQGSPSLAHFTYESLLWRRETGTGAGVEVI